MCNKQQNVKTLYAQQSGCCFYCKQPMLKFVTKGNMSTSQFTTAQQQPLYPTYEHAIVARKDGGSPSLKNGVCSCFQCNQLRGIISHNAFRMLVTSKESQQLLVDRPPAKTNKAVEHVGIKHIMSTMGNIISRKLSQYENKLKIKLVKPVEINEYTPFPIPRSTAIKKLLPLQDYKCACCNLEIIPLYSLPRAEYLNHKHRPVYKKHNNTVVRFGCSGKAKNNK